MNSKSILIPLMFFLAGTVLHAQYSDEAFEQKEAGELYDERGFLQNKAITVDGNLVVSNSNGNVSYSYPGLLQLSCLKLEGERVRVQYESELLRVGCLFYPWRI